MFDFLKERRRRRRRRQQDPAKQIGQAVGKGIATVLVGVVTNMLRRK